MTDGIVGPPSNGGAYFEINYPDDEPTDVILKQVGELYEAYYRRRDWQQEFEKLLNLYNEWLE